MSSANAAPFVTRKLGRANVEVSELGIGTAPLGELWDIIEEEEAGALLEDGMGRRRALFRHLALVRQGSGRASRRARALSPVRATPIVISSKIGRLMRRPLKPGPFEHGEWLGGLEFDAVFDYSYDGVMRSFEDSLQRLGINRIDVLLIHDLDTWHFKTEAQRRALHEPALHQRLARAGGTARPGRHQGHRRRLQHDGHDPQISRHVRHRLLPDRDALHAAGTGRARPRISALRRARRRHRHRRALQFRHHRDGDAGRRRCTITSRRVRRFRRA